MEESKTNIEEKKKLGLWTLVLLIFVPTFGFGNVTNNAVEIGPASIPSWIIVAVLYFLPLSIMIAELASISRDKGGGIYSWIDCQLGSNWAFIGTWSYFISNLFFLQWVFTALPISFSWAIFGHNIFNDSNAYLLPWLALVVNFLLTFIASKGVGKFSKISDLGGKLILGFTSLFIIFSILGFVIGKTPSATEFTSSNMLPTFDGAYFGTFAWLLLAVAGAEVSGTYIKQVDNPKKTYPRSVLLATLFVALAYTLGSVAVCLIASPEILANAGIKDANYAVYEILGNNWGFNGRFVVQMFGIVNSIAAVGAYTIWVESPLRAMFAEVPERTFPKFLTKQREDGTMINALWTQAGILAILILTPMVGLKSIDGFFELLATLSSLSLVIPYVILAVAYLVFRMKGSTPDFVIIKSKGMAIAASAAVLLLGVLAFVGAGWGEVEGAASLSDAALPMIQYYGGPAILIALGYLLVLATKRFSKEDVEKYKKAV